MSDLTQGWDFELPKVSGQWQVKSHLYAPMNLQAHRLKHLLLKLYSSFNQLKIRGEFMEVGGHYESE